MNLAMMRDINAADPIGGLGPRVTPAPTPAPEPVKRPDGFVEGPDGKLSTSLPPPAVPRRGSWPFPTGTAAPEPEPGAHGFMREPLKVGDRLRHLEVFHFDRGIPLLGRVTMLTGSGDSLRARVKWNDGTTSSESGDYEGQEWERVE